MNKKNILLVGDIAVVNPFFNALDGFGHLLEVAANYEEVISITDKESFDFAFIYVNSSNSKTYQALEIIADNKDTKIFVITDDFTGNTMSSLTNFNIESVIFFPTKKEYIDELIQEYFNSTTKTIEQYKNYEVNDSQLRHDVDKHTDFESSIYKENERDYEEESEKNNSSNEEKSDERKGLLEDQIVFDFTDDVSSYNNTNKNNNEYNAKRSISEKDKSSNYIDEGIAIRPPRIRVNTPISDILSKKESQMRIKNVPEIVVDNDKNVSNNNKEEKGFFSKIKKIFK